MNECKEIKNVLKDSNVYELERLERNLSDYIDKKYELPRDYYMQDWYFFESDREGIETDEINFFIKQEIIDYGLYQVRDVVVDLLRKTTTEKNNKLQCKIIEWGRVRNIKSPKSQLLKVIEEIGEIQLAKDKNEFMDAIGDTLVTLIILNDVLQRKAKEGNENEIELLDIERNTEEDFHKYLEKKKESKEYENLTHCINTDILVEVSKIAEYIRKMTKQAKRVRGRHVEKIHFHILETVKYVKYLALYKDADYIECLQLAYDTMKKI